MSIGQEPEGVGEGATGRDVIQVRGREQPVHAYWQA